ncbi:MAG: HD domain-containing protein [Ruminococcaceae bacterium]|nr:HD domain-containing protein [Oscillospiraceae bacterium]
MKKEEFRLLYDYMTACAEGGAHDTEHVRRVLAYALEIARTEKRVDHDVLIAACLLHDVGREAQAKDPALCHAEVGAKMAYRFLREQGYTGDFAAAVRDAVLTHRFRKDRPPRSMEAKILFDADKLDVVGAMGIARTLEYRAEVGEPLYTLLPGGSVSDGDGDDSPSFFQEYHRKLKRIYDSFYTKRGTEIAESRRAAAERYYEALLTEVRETYAMQEHLEKVVE